MRFRPGELKFYAENKAKAKYYKCVIWEIIRNIAFSIKASGLAVALGGAIYGFDIFMYPFEKLNEWLKS